MSERGIDYFGRAHPLARIQAAASLRARRLVYDWFSHAIGGLEGKSVLDHGSTPDTERADSNCFIRWLSEDGARVFAASPENIQHLESRYPGLTVLPWPLGEFASPVDVIISSAVIEHTGAADAQRRYIRDLLRRCRTLLLIAPNRGHWLEFHTKLPLIHWLPKDTHRRILSTLGMHFWAKEANLNLLDQAELAGLIREAAGDENVAIDVRWFTPRLLGSVSNLAALITRH